MNPLQPPKLAPIPGDPTDPAGLHRLALEYLEYLAARHYSPTTISSRSHHLAHFIAWALARALLRPVEVTYPVLLAYQRALYHQKTRAGEPLSFRTQSLHLTSLRSLFRWLARSRHIPSNPAADLELPKGEFRLPTQVLAPDQVEAILQLPNLTTPRGLRDRAILETFYSAAIRRTELVGLQLADCDLSRRILQIRLGKGLRDRLVPIGPRAARLLDRYLHEARPDLAINSLDTTLFLSATGSAFTPDSLSRLVRGYLVQAGITARGSCHLFRHAAATAMLERGCDIRFIQALLGHAKLSTTQLYTHVAIGKLQQIHDRTHPAGAGGKPGAGNDQVDELHAGLDLGAIENDPEPLEELEDLDGDGEDR